MILLSLLLTACTTHPRPVHLSPEAIIDHIQGKGLVALKEIWGQLQIDSQRLSDLWKEEALFQVDRVDFHLGDQTDEYAVLSITNTSGLQSYMHWQVLVLAREHTDWKFLGNIDIFGQMWKSAPQPKLTLIDNQLYLITKQLNVTGTGILVYDDVWYQLGTHAPTEVLRYPIEGHVVLSSKWLTLRFEGKVVKQWLAGGNPKVTTQLAGFYSSWDAETGEDVLLFSEQATIEHAWDGSRRQFAVNPERSEHLPEQVETGFRFYTDNRELIALHYLDLAGIARNGAPDQQQWLRMFLNEAADSPEKTALLNLLIR